MWAIAIPSYAVCRDRADGYARGSVRWLWSLQSAGTPHEIALGAAVGMFVAVTPTPGMQMLLAAALAGALRGSARAAMAMTFFSNPFTALPLNAIAYMLGRPFCPSSPALSWADFSAAFTEATATWNGMLLLGERLLLPLVVGSILLGLILAPLSYAATRLACRRAMTVPAL